MLVSMKTKLKMVRCAALAAVLFALGAMSLSAEEGRKVTVGTHLLFGGRYDNVRMCVGSPAGVPGGPIGDLYFDIRFPTSPNGTLVLNIPVFRPILFAASFQMLQFEPQVTYEYLFTGSGGARPVLGGGLGIVLHYGPDYLSSPTNRGPDFFAAGPLVSVSFGFRFSGKSGSWTPGIKAFAAPLFGDPGYLGFTAGGALELHWTYET